MVKTKGKGGLSHQNLQQCLARHFRAQGKLAVVEAFIGKNVDILVYDSKKTIAVEIQITPQHCLENIKEDFRLGCDEVWILCTSTEVLNNIKNKAQQHLDNTLWNKTKFYLVEDFIPHPNNNNTNITRNKVVEESSGIKSSLERR